MQQIHHPFSVLPYVETKIARKNKGIGLTVANMQFMPMLEIKSFMLLGRNVVLLKQNTCFTIGYQWKSPPFLPFLTPKAK